jgi:hypothetical protein
MPATPPARVLRTQTTISNVAIGEAIGGRESRSCEIARLAPIDASATMAVSDNVRAAEIRTHIAAAGTTSRQATTEEARHPLPAPAGID